MITRTPPPRADALSRGTAAGLLVVSALVVALVLADVGGPLRLVAVVVFALVAPGWAIVAFWRPASLSLQWALAAALSIALQILVAMTMVVTGTWSPVPVFVVLAVLTAGLLVVHLRSAGAAASAGIPA